MRVLILGGTQFIGRHLVERLLGDGHELTLANRGVTGMGIFPEIPRLRIDRRGGDIAALRQARRDWDGVVDLSCYFPAELEATLEALRGRIGRYVFCSTISVYERLESERYVGMLRESDATLPCSPEQATDPSMRWYGARKAECERLAQAHAREPGGVPVVILRPSLVYGAQDHTDRFAWWIRRAASRKRFILPEEGLTITRRTYAPDLADAFRRALRSPTAVGHAYNVAEPDALSFRDTLTLLGRHLGVDPLERASGLGAEELLAQGLQAWSDIPLWIPRSHLLIDTFAARRDLGHEETPPAQALASAADAFLALGREPIAGISEAREEEILRKCT